MRYPVWESNRLTPFFLPRIIKKQEIAQPNQTKTNHQKIRSFIIFLPSHDGCMLGEDRAKKQGVVEGAKRGLRPEGRRAEKFQIPSA